jgi:hypothetical protein
VNNGDWIKHFLGAGNVPRQRGAQKGGVPHVQDSRLVA